MEKIVGRWDITFVEKPRYQPDGYFDKIDKAYLIAISENHPEAWEALKDLIRTVDEVV